MSRELDELLDMLEMQSRSNDNYTLSSYEEDESYEVENFLKRAQGIPTFQARKMAVAAVKNPVALQKIRQQMAKNSGRGAMQIEANANQPAAAAQFDIVITRNSANIAETLPVVLFDPQDAANGYRAIVSGLLPAGTVLTSVRYGENLSQPNALRFTYTKGVDVDTIDVTCPQYPYPALLNSAITDLLRLSKIRYSISDTAQLSQFSNGHAIVQRTMFGKKSENALSIGAYKRPDQFQTGIIDVDGVFELDKETGILLSINASAGFSVTISSFVEKFYRQSAKGF